MKRARRSPPAVVKSPDHPGLPPGSSLGSLWARIPVYFTSMPAKATDDAVSSGVVRAASLITGDATSAAKTSGVQARADEKKMQSDGTEGMQNNRVIVAVSCVYLGHFEDAWPKLAYHGLWRLMLERIFSEAWCKHK